MVMFNLPKDLRLKQTRVQQRMLEEQAMEIKRIKATSMCMYDS